MTYLLRLSACLFLLGSFQTKASISLTVNLDYINDPNGYINEALGINPSLGDPITWSANIDESHYVNNLASIDTGTAYSSPVFNYPYSLNPDSYADFFVTGMSNVEDRWTFTVISDGTPFSSSDYNQIGNYEFFKSINNQSLGDYWWSHTSHILSNGYLSTGILLRDPTANIIDDETLFIADINNPAWQIKDIQFLYVPFDESSSILIAAGYVTTIPLPAGIYLFLSGLVGLGLMRGRNG